MPTGRWGDGMTPGPQGTPALSAALQDLALAIDRLDPLALTPAQRSDLQTLRQAAQRLGRDGPQPRYPDASGIRHFEPARLDRLLQLAGPEAGQELLARLGEDLRETRQTACQAVPGPDWPAMRGASHVLISLSGSVGALSLQDLAERLNLAANSQDRTGMQALIGQTLAELDALIVIVDTLSADRRGRR